MGWWWYPNINGAATDTIRSLAGAGRSKFHRRSERPQGAMSSFTAPLDIRSLPGGRVALLRSLEWRSNTRRKAGGSYRTVTVVLGFMFDGASIPRFIWPLIGHPLSSTVIRAAAIHDWLYSTHRWDYMGESLHELLSTHRRWDLGKTITRAEADREFRDALKLDGTGLIRRWIMWAAVRVFGFMAWRRSYERGPQFNVQAEREVAELWRALAKG